MQFNLQDMKPENLSRAQELVKQYDHLVLTRKLAVVIWEDVAKGELSEWVFNLFDSRIKELEDQILAL